MAAHRTIHCRMTSSAFSVMPARLSIWSFSSAVGLVLALWWLFRCDYSTMDSSDGFTHCDYGLLAIALEN